MVTPFCVFSTACVVSNFPNLWWCDYICAIGISTLILLKSYPSIAECLNVLMEGSPRRIKGDEIEKDIWSVCEGDVVDVHDLHLWSLS